MRDELPEPQGGFITRWAPIDDGVYFVDTTKGPTIAVHETVAADELSETARDLGKPRGGYRYYRYPEEAIPIYELSRTRRAVFEFANRDRDEETLRKYFPDYWAERGDDEDEPEI